MATFHSELRGDRCGSGHAGKDLRHECHRVGNSLSSCRAKRWCALRLSV